MAINKTQKMQPQQRLQIREGMTVEEVKKYGSEGQKLAASLFDENDTKDEKTGHYLKNGVYSEREAKYFNQYNFSVKNNVFTMYNRESNQTTEIKYKNLEDLKRILNEDYNRPWSLHFFQNDKQKVFVGESTKNGKITLDLHEGTVTCDGVEGDFIYASGKKVTVSNSDVKTIGSHAKELEIQNTRDKGLIWDSATEVEAGKDTIVKIDDKSDVELKRDDK